MTLAETIRAAVADVAEHGYDSEERITRWMSAIRQAAETELVSVEDAERMAGQAIRQAYERAVDRGGLFRHHPGVSQYTVQRVRPQLRAELDRRLAANRGLIRLNREEAMLRTERRFAGWATSVPAGGSPDVDRVKVRQDVRKPLASMPFEQRRVAIDQGHKLVAAVSHIVAMDGDAIAGRWRSHWREIGYDYRPEHKARDQQVYAVRGSWAGDQGLITKGAGYVDEIDQPAEKPYCRCFWVWIYNLRDIPPEMLTAAGREAVAA